MYSLFLGGILFAQKPNIKVSVPTRVEIDNHFQLTYQIDADIDSFSANDFGQMQILSGPNRSQRSNIQVVNGKVSQNIHLSYTYILMPTKEGKWKTPKTTFKYKGKVYTAPTKTIEVVKASTNNATTTPSGTNKGKTKTAGKYKKSDLYVKASANKNNVYLGEQLVVTYKIYTRVPVSNLEIEKNAAFNGFWTVDMNDDDAEILQQERKIINGKEYVVATLKKTALFPQKIGKLSIQPIKLNCIVQVKTKNQRHSTNDPFFDSFFNDPFFNNNYKNVERILSSNSLEINVKDLPATNKPDTFNGAVGEFNLSSNIDSKEVTANEAITIKYTLSGVGNIELVPDLNIDFPADFEVYDPKITTKTRVRGNKINGYKIFEYTIIPRSAGDFEIPPVQFSYFNPEDETYKNLQSDTYQIHVNKGRAKSSDNQLYAANLQEDVRYLGKDIRYIALMPFKLLPANQFFYGSWFYIGSFVVPLFLLTILILWNRSRKRRRGNVMYMKNRNATKIARKRLKRARVFLKKHAEKDFYNEIARALWGYVSDKFAIPLSELSMDTVNEKLTEKAVDKSLIKSFIEVLDNCEYARFAPGNKDTTMENIYKKGIEVISKIENNLK